MKPALLLVDVQYDFLSQVQEPHPEELVHTLDSWLQSFRAQGWPVFHLRTEVTLEPDTRMPHWVAEGRKICLRGEPGSLPPPQCESLESEAVFTKSYFSGFTNANLESALSESGAEVLILAGIHTQSCLLQTALDAYQRGLNVGLAEGAIGSYDPLAGATTELYLSKRRIRTYSLAELQARPPTSRIASKTLPSGLVGEAERATKGETWTHHRPVDGTPCWSFNETDIALLDEAVERTERAHKDWRQTELSTRITILESFADLLERNRENLTSLLVEDIGKPVSHADGEVSASAAMVRSIIARLEADLTVSDPRYRRCPVGTVALVTPFNNPLMIPVGKFAAALAFGNGVVWKPAPSGSRISLEVAHLLTKAGLPPDTLNLVLGGAQTAVSLFAHPRVDVVTLSGGMRAGRFALSICSSLHRPLQAELGGNNAAVAWGQVEWEKVAAEVTAGAFGFAGQRCTANRRLIVERKHLETALEALTEKTRDYPVGDPSSESTDCGPLISEEQRSRVRRTLEIASEARRFSAPEAALPGFYQTPTLLWSCRPESHLVQEESFGPLLVVQTAETFEQAVSLANGVKQGLVASLFSTDEELQSRFLSQAQAGILKLNTATHGAHPEVPFGGWKKSGLGPPEHGPGDGEFYTKWQAVYG